MEVFSDDDLYEFDDQLEPIDEQSDHEFYGLSKDELAPEFDHGSEWNPEHAFQFSCAPSALPFIEIDDLLERLDRIDTLVKTSEPSMAHDRLKIAIRTLDDIAREHNLLDSQKRQVAIIREQYEVQMRALNGSVSSQKKKKKKSPANRPPAPHKTRNQGSRKTSKNKPKSHVRKT